MTKISDPTLFNINQVTSIVNESRKKIIFWDTCALLDIIRFPRDNELVTFIDLIKIHNEIMNDKVYSIASEITITEFNDHVIATINETKDLIKKASQQYNSIVTAITHFTSALADHNIVDLSSYNIERYLINIVEDILSKTIFIEKKEIAPLWLDRIVLKKTPLKRKGEYKDAAIWCTCLSLSEKIAISGDNDSVLFFSSNVNDYYEAGTKNFNRDISTECSMYNIFFGINFTEISSKL